MIDLQVTRLTLTYWQDIPYQSMRAQMLSCMNIHTNTQNKCGQVKYLNTQSWSCNFAIGIPHRNIMDKREEELRIPEDLTVREGRYITEDTSSGCAWSFFTFFCCQGEEWVCFQAIRLHQVGLLLSETHSLTLSLLLFCSLSFHLIYYPYFQLDCIISCHFAFRHHS